MNQISGFSFGAEPMTRSDNCERHGAFESKCIIGSVWSKCPSCADEEIEMNRKAREQKDRDDRHRSWMRRVEGSGIPDRFHDRSLKTFIARSAVQQRALDFAQAYADGFDEILKTGRSAVFVGKPGTGKTHMACGIGLRIMHRNNRSVLFTSVLHALRRLKETWHKVSTETESQVVEAFVSPDLLILDEVGQQFGSETEKLILFDILNGRYEKRRPTLLLANIPLDDYENEGQGRPGIKSFLGERIIDRIREDGGEFVVFDWESNRGKASAQ